MTTDTLPTYLDSLARRERAARHAVLLPLLIHTLALALVLAFEALFYWRLSRVAVSESSAIGWEMVAEDPRMLLPVLPLTVYVMLWVVSRIRASRTGVGPGHDGWGIMAIVSAGCLLLFPVNLFLWLYLGAAFFLGLGLVVLGGRMREPLLWAAGLVLMAIGPFLALGTIGNHATFLGPWPDVTALAILLVGLAATTATAWHRERRTLVVPTAVTP